MERDLPTEMHKLTWGKAIIYTVHYEHSVVLKEQAMMMILYSMREWVKITRDTDLSPLLVMYIPCARLEFLRPEQLVEHILIIIIILKGEGIT